MLISNGVDILNWFIHHQADIYNLLQSTKHHNQLAFVKLVLKLVTEVNVEISLYEKLAEYILLELFTYNICLTFGAIYISLTLTSLPINSSSDTNVSSLRELKSNAFSNSIW